jgi:hypothetical protein
MQAEIVFEENVEKNLMEDKIMVEDNNSKQYASLAERIAAERIQKSQAQPRSLRSIARNPNSFNFDLAVQRNLRWTDFQVSELIESILLGYPIPPVYAVKSEDNITWCIDGKQRFKRAIIPFMRDEIAIVDDFRPVFGVDISGKRFSELPVEFQEILEEFHIVIYQFEKLTPTQRDDFFRRLNNGTPLSAIELTRSILGSELLDYINNLIETPFMQKVALSDKQRDKYVDQELVLQMISIITERGYDIGSKEMREFALKLRIDGLSQEEKDKIRKTFDFLSVAFASTDEKTAKKILKKADVIGIVGAAVKATCTPEVFSEKLSIYIANQASGSNYANTKRNKSSSADSVKRRIEILIGVLEE